MKYTVNELVEIINSKLLPTYNNSIRETTLDILVKEYRKKNLAALLRKKNVY